MPAQAREIKSRLQSIRNTKKITKAMELVAAAKMRRAVVGVLATRNYANLMWEIMQRLRTSVVLKPTDSAYRFLRPVTTDPDTKKRTAIVVFTSNRGLCGSFNSHMVKLVAQYVKNHPEETITVIGIGKKGVGMLGSLGVNVQQAYVKDDTAKTAASIIEINQALYEQFQKGEFDQVMLGYTDYRSAIAQTPTLKTLFPYAQEAGISAAVDNLTEEMIDAALTAPERQYLYEPNRAVILNYLVPRIAEVQLYQALLESNASEHSSRMLAMKNATDAAKDMADALLLAFNRARQAGITQEIAEISAGSAAVS